MATEDGTDTDDQTGGLGPDQVTTPPLQHQGATMDNPLVASLIDDKPPKSGDAAETAMELDPTATQTAGDASDPADPEATTTDDAGEQATDQPPESPPEDPPESTPDASEDNAEGDAKAEPADGKEQAQADPYLKQLSQQLATLSNQYSELKEQIGQQQAAAQQDPEATAEEQAELDQAQDDLGKALDEMASLEKALDDRDELEGLEPGDLKAVIKTMGGLVKRVQAAETRAQQAEQAAQSTARQSSVEAFFEKESKTHGIDAKQVWTQASDDAVKYLGEHKPGTPGYEMAQKYAQTRYGELVQQAKTSRAKPDAKAKAQDPPKPDPVKPPAKPGNQPRQDPKGTVTQPAGSRPAAEDGSRDTKAIISGLIVPD